MLYSVLTLVLLVSALVHGDDRLIPRVLGDADIDRYRQIIDLQTEGDWTAAAKGIKQLDDTLLIGHLDFQRLMHPTAYRSSYRELRSWMQAYADHPNAWRIYRLARRRQGRAQPPRRPVETDYPGVTGHAAAPGPPTPPRDRFERRAASRFRTLVRRYVRKGEPERAEKRFWAMRARGLLTAHELADALERISASYYYNGDNGRALALATLGAEMARETAPVNDWIAGLAHWRLGALAAAYRHFVLLGQNERAGPWLGSAGEYWAARAKYRLGDPFAGATHLRAATDHGETFYSLIAARQLGMHRDIDWSPPALSRSQVKRLMAFPAVRRAIALTEVGRDDLADEELRLLWGREGTAVQDDLLALAAHLKLPAIQIRLGRAGGGERHAPPSTRYPLPDWQPADGFRVDRALIFAMVRQESSFGSRARSGVGARGLMQLLPATASLIARDRSLFRRNKNRLFEPEFNLALGQAYLEQLLGHDYVEGNLFMMLAAYNGGPGSLLRWKQEVDYQNDPLLFIESIGFFETRHFIERVMSNLWLYRLRLGQETPALDAVASGAWPTMVNLDTPAERDIERRRRERLAQREGAGYARR